MSPSPIIELNNARIFQRENLVLNNVDLTVRPGEFIYLVGRTGTGKSSLMRTLYGDIALTEGEGHVCGFDLHTLKRKQIPYLRRKLGIVFQDFQLLTDRTVNENLLFVMKATGWTDAKRMDQRIQEVLEKVGLGNKGYKLPHELSGGEQQRVSIARALVNDPELILADEPTGNLDSRSSAEILDFLARATSEFGQTVVMVTHDPVAAARADRVVFLNDGRIVDDLVRPTWAQLLERTGTPAG